MVKAIESKAKETVDGKENALKAVGQIKEQHALEIQELERAYLKEKS